MNAAVSVGLTVANTVNHFSANIMTAFRPQIIKHYSRGEKEQMKNLTILAIKVIMFIYSLVAIPVFVEAEQLLQLWLVEVPDHAVVFCRLFLISIFFETIRYILIIDIHATGNVKLVSMFSGTIFILVPIITYILFYLGVNVNAAFAIIIVCNFILCLVNTFLVRYYVDIKIGSFVKSIFLVTMASLLALLFALYVKTLIPNEIIHIFTNTIIAVIILSGIYITLCFNRHQIKSAIKIFKRK